MSHVSGRDILPETSVLFVCDTQEAFRNHCSNFAAIVEVIRRLIEASNLLHVPIIATEQYPKGLGLTVKELNLTKATLFEKSTLSMVTPEVENHLVNNCHGRKHVILCGLETHVCVLQTGLDLLSKGFEVHLIADGCTSRTEDCRIVALRRLEKAGCTLSTYETVLFQLLRHKDHPQFKAVQNILKTLPPSSGLVLPKL